MFNAKIKMENRNVNLFLDSAICQPKVALSNVKIAWFPADATSVLQTMDMGVIYTFKSHYRQFLMQSLVLDAVNWIILSVKNIKAETVKSILLKLGLGKVMRQIIWRRRVKTLLQWLISAEENNFVRSDYHLATHYSFESATAVLAVRNTQNEDVVNEEEEEEGGGEQDISTKIHTHEHTLHCISEVIQFPISSNSSSNLQILFIVKDCIQKDMNTTSGNKFLCWICGRNLNE
jgi:hypothetical protein